MTGTDNVVRTSFGWRLLLRIVMPALVVTGVGLYLLIKQYQDDRARLETIRQARALNAADELRDAIREVGTTNVACQAILSAWPQNQSETTTIRPVGAFIWSSRKKLVWHQGGHAALWELLGKRVYWTEWLPHAKRTSQLRRALQTIDMEQGRMYVLWGRVDNLMYGLVFDDFPVVVDSRSWLWLAGVCFVGLLTAYMVLAAVQLWRAAERARRDDELKTRFVSDVSHELKTPLAAMGLWADMLSGGRIADEGRQRHALDVIREEKDRMLRMVEMLLDYTRLEQNRRRYSIEDVDVGEVAREVVELLRADFGEHRVSVTSSEDRARADRDAVKAIFLNLLGNAAKYAADGGPVEVSVSSADGKVRAVVADRGPGLSDEARGHVFERFYRSDDNASSAKGGFGLGLPISRRLARDMGGELTVAPRDGGGLEFVLELPSCP